ncbi:MAG: type III-B CRISPR-associated protein Cas10/Cmr2 [Cyanobacteria bacterium P01_G01_bin.38]
MSDQTIQQDIQVAIAWCLAWGSNLEPRYPIEQFQKWRVAIAQGEAPSDQAWQQALDEAKALTQFEEGKAKLSVVEIRKLIDNTPALWKSSIGLVYGGVTKVKSYVFESADLQEIRGASALLDRINLVDLPAFFHAETSTKYELCFQAPQYCQRVRDDVFLQDADDETKVLILEALMPALIVYATGGKILAFCPAAFVDQLSNAIEKRYTQETLTANSCAVGAAFRPIEIYLGLLKDPIETNLWHNTITAEYKDNVALQAYFGFDGHASEKDIETAFRNRKNFGELVAKLTNQFNQRRSGYDHVSNDSDKAKTRPSRRFPPMFETHPYVLRDDSDIRSAVVELTADDLPDAPKLSEPTARKRRVGQITKRDDISERWYVKSGFKEHWDPTPTPDGETVFQSWVSKLEKFLREEQRVDDYDSERYLFNEHGNIKNACKHTREARSLHEIGDSSNGYVAYIYADGNNMGAYIRDKIKTPAKYQQFSEDIFRATEQSVYHAITNCIQPYLYKPDAKSSRQPNKKDKDPVWIHPFEIITIGGDDVLLVVPANKAFEVAKAIGQHFERLLLDKGQRYVIDPPTPPEKQKGAHRYLSNTSPASTCCLSTSSGVLITAADTPIYYADKLVTQLLKSAKQHLKTLKKANGYYGGTVDFLVLKAVTMVSSNIAAFRKAGLTISPPNRPHKLKLYAAPYTLYELGGLIDTVKALKRSGFPKSQLYQIRDLLERGKRTAILNYRYFRVRLAAEKRALLEDHFEQAWCNASTNGGNIAPWLTANRERTQGNDSKDGPTHEKELPTIYETIWRELVELEPFIEVTDDEADDLPVLTAQSQGRSS